LERGEQTNSVLSLGIVSWIGRKSMEWCNTFFVLLETFFKEK